MNLAKTKDISKTFYWYLALAIASVLYIVTSLIAPLGPNRFNLTPAKTHVLQLSLLLPIVVIWWIAFYGAERFKNYTSKIKSDKDGRALDTIATGLVILVATIILNGLFGVLRSWAVQGNWLAAFTNLSNHLSALGPLIAYSYMFAGSLQLRKLIKKRKISHTRLIVLTTLLVLIAAVYIKTIVSYKYLSSTPDQSRYSSFYMSGALVFLTIGLPYLIGWGLAIASAINIAEYSNQVKGIVYRSMLLRFVIGTYLVVAFYIIVQMLIAFSTFFAKAGLGTLLLIVYLLIIGYAVGFVLIASGVKKLSRIEKV